MYHQYIILPNFGMLVPSFFVMDQETAGFVEPYLCIISFCVITAVITKNFKENLL